MAFSARFLTGRFLNFFRYSDELVFADFARPFYLKKNDEMRFWYGEDLKKYGDKDNQGQVCFNVLVLFV